MSAATGFSPRRVGAMVLRHLYLLRGSWPRAFELVYWPTLTMVLWGFTSQFLVTNSSWVARAGGVLIYAVLLWEVMFRGQLGVAFSFLEEMWSNGGISRVPCRFRIIRTPRSKSMFFSSKLKSSPNRAPVVYARA